jgi:hypothetical protein
MSRRPTADLLNIHKLKLDLDRSMVEAQLNPHRLRHRVNGRNLANEVSERTAPDARPLSSMPSLAVSGSVAHLYRPLTTDH